MRLGFIGAGNMAQAMIGGILAKEIVKKEDIIASAATQKTIDKVAKEFGINVTLDNREVAKADIVFLAVKPFYYEYIHSQSEYPKGCYLFNGLTVTARLV